VAFTSETFLMTLLWSVSDDSTFLHPQGSGLLTVACGSSSLW
jgi:hypothetical protein